MHFQPVLINNYIMSRFNTLLENHLGSTELSRIRIKFDPANENDERREYVGYVLEEDGTGGVIAIGPQLGPDVQSFSSDEFEPMGDCGDPLAGFKKHVVDFLMTRGFHEKVSEYMEHIIDANNPEQLEKIVVSCGCESTMILDMYRDYVSNERL